MTLKDAIKLFEQIETVPAVATDVETAINIIVNSDDFSQMSCKGLHNVIWFLVEHMERYRIEIETD